MSRAWESCPTLQKRGILISRGKRLGLYKEKILQAAREKQQITHKGIAIRITADLSIETLQARREWQDILKVMKEKNLQPRLLYPERMERGPGIALQAMQE